MDNQEDFYQSFRTKIREWLQDEEGKTNKWAEYLMCAPDLFHLICKLAIDPDVLVADKAKLAGVIVYFISPVDLVPEALTGPLGYVDDIALTAYVLNGIMTHTDPLVVQKHWAGDRDVLELIKQILAVADQMVGSGIWNKLKGKF